MTVLSLIMHSRWPGFYYLPPCRSTVIMLCKKQLPSKEKTMDVDRFCIIKEVIAAWQPRQGQKYTENCTDERLLCIKLTLPKCGEAGSTSRELSPFEAL